MYSRIIVKYKEFKSFINSWEILHQHLRGKIQNNSFRGQLSDFLNNWACLQYFSELEYRLNELTNGKQIFVLLWQREQYICYIYLTMFFFSLRTQLYFNLRITHPLLESICANSAYQVILLGRRPEHRQKSNTETIVLREIFHLKKNSLVNSPRSPRSVNHSQMSREKNCSYLILRKKERRIDATHLINVVCSKSRQKKILYHTS